MLLACCRPHGDVVLKWDQIELQKDSPKLTKSERIHIEKLWNEVLARSDMGHIECTLNENLLQSSTLVSSSICPDFTSAQQKLSFSLPLSEMSLLQVGRNMQAELSDSTTAVKAEESEWNLQRVQDVEELAILKELEEIVQDVIRLQQLVHSEEAFSEFADQLAVKIQDSPTLTKQHLRLIMESFSRAVREVVDDEVFQKNKKAFQKFLSKTYYHLTRPHREAREGGRRFSMSSKASDGSSLLSSFMFRFSK